MRINREVPMFEIVLKRFDIPDEVRIFERGRFELVTIGGMTIGRAIYEPGWKWSEHVGKASGKTSCDVEHVAVVLSGVATAAMDDGRIVEMKAGHIFYIGGLSGRILRTAKRYYADPGSAPVVGRGPLQSSFLNISLCMRIFLIAAILLLTIVKYDVLRSTAIIGASVLLGLLFGIVSITRRNESARTGRL
jgi:hypothetical protein